MAFETTTDEVIKGVDLSGRVALVTGASSGLGLETSRALAAAGAHVVLAVRDKAKGEATLAELRERVPGASLEYGELELSSLDSVRAFAGWFLDTHPRLDLLVNNAGIMATPYGRTADGFEQQFGTNHLGHFLLTNLLTPALLAAAPARVVNLSSAGHRRSDIRWDDVHFDHGDYEAWTAYGQSKTVNILFSVELDRRLASSGVRAYAVHPGVIMTQLSRHLTEQTLKTLTDTLATTGREMPAMKTVEAGAATQVWAATATELDGTGGIYLEDAEISPNVEPYALDPASAQRLWSMSEQLVGESFPGR